jgi:hypothetical protein
MNKKIIVASLAKIANKLDSNKLYSKANEITEIMVKIAQEDPGQDDPELTPPNPEIQQEIQKIEKNNLQKQTELDKKVEDTNSLDQLYILRDELINKPPFDKITMQYYINGINEKITLLEMTVLKKFQQLISKPYFESNIKNFQAIGSKIEQDPAFKNLHEKTKEKIRLYYSNLAKKIQTRSQERGNIPLLNTDTMQGKPDQISSFVIKNMQYEANKIVSPQTLQPIMQNYLANILEENNASELEEERKLRFIKDTYKVDGIEAYQLASVLRDPKQENMRATFQSYEQDLMIEELIDEFKALKELSSTILENAKKYAQTGSEDSFERVYKSTLPFTDFAPVRTIYNLKEFVYNNYKSLSKSVSDANKLFTAVNEAHQKVESALRGSPNKDRTRNPTWFKLPTSQEQMDENRKLYTPLYPGSRPPEQ